MIGTIELGLHDIRINGQRFEKTEAILTRESSEWAHDKLSLKLTGFGEDYQRLLDIYAVWARVYMKSNVEFPPYELTGKLDDESKVKMNFTMDRYSNNHDRHTVEIEGPVMNYVVIEEPAELQLRRRIDAFEAKYAEKPDYIVIGQKVVENLSKQLKSMMLINMQTEEAIKAEALKKKYGTITKFDGITIIPLHGVKDNYIECVKYKHWTDTGVPIYK